VFPVASTGRAEQPAITAPFAVKLTFPEGAIGVRATPPRAAVNVTVLLTLVEFEGADVKFRVAASGLMTSEMVEDTLVEKLESPEYAALMLCAVALSEFAVHVAV